MALRRGKPAARHGTYDEWAAFLDLWSRGEPADLSALAPLHAEDFQGETWSRLTNRIIDAVNRRFEAWQAALVRATGAAAADEFEYGRALQQSRDGLRPIRDLAGNELFPADLRENLTKIVDNKLRDIQQQLEDSTERMRDRGDSIRMAERRLHTLRSNALTAVTTQAQQGQPGWNPPADGTPRKRIIQR